MSYDIFFVRRDPGQSFEDAIDATEEDFGDGDPGPLQDVDFEVWDRILPRARTILGDIEVFEDAESRSLTHPRTGIELSLIPGEVAINVGPGQSPVDSVELMHTVYMLARAVEDETGLEGYDPQLGEPITDVRAEKGRGPKPARHAEQEDQDHGPTGVITRPERPEKVQVPERPSRRRWWEFWKP